MNHEVDIHGHFTFWLILNLLNFWVKEIFFPQEWPASLVNYLIDMLKESSIQVNQIRNLLGILGILWVFVDLAKNFMFLKSELCSDWCDIIFYEVVDLI